MEEIIIKLKEEWTFPKPIINDGEQSFFKFACEFNAGIYTDDAEIPSDLQKFYRISNGAILFKDVDYGQWGLKIIPYGELQSFNDYTRNWRGDDIEDMDLVIGEFLGDLELVLLSLNDYEYGQVIICPEIDKRDDWYFLKINFKEFLEKYVEAKGDKFWTIS
ncbi:MAG: SMI1/KNR4 family protein [Runella slithyformis]|nr:MAG: SMI1/KNR4 family protein [Runella slithyformis]TAF28664.1 MAG: SMI1/KNR4 family protein [Runella slithyformis]TAF82381.1 MAG: SMI1/KNR4 family protein [Runella slithyformis]